MMAKIKDAQPDIMNIYQILKNQQDGNNINSTATEICSCVIKVTELNQKDYSNYIGRQAKDPVCVCMIDHQPSDAGPGHQIM